jgi:undecaprenyl-phosphate galactose phosphotransferase
MSLVGPRPIVSEETAKYGSDFQYLLMAKGGMTGISQVSGRNDLDYSERIALDCFYVRNWSIWADIVILLKTLGAVLTRSGAY